MLDHEINVDYFEGNEQLAQLLPRSGVIVRKVVLEDWDGDWYLLQLKEPFDYQHKLAEPYIFKEFHITHLLIKSRWVGHNISETSTSVFLLLVPDVSLFDLRKVFSEDFIFAGWATTTLR